jgi:hypothetical protein
MNTNHTNKIVYVCFILIVLLGLVAILLVPHMQAEGASPALPVESTLPYLGKPVCLEDGIRVHIGWTNPPVNPDYVHAIAFLFAPDGGERVTIMTYIGEVNGTHYWYGMLENPYPAHWWVYADVMVSPSEPFEVQNQNRAANCDVFLPIGLR